MHSNYFTKISKKSSSFIGSYTGFAITVILLLTWAISGFFLHFGHKWEILLILPGEVVTLVTLFLMKHDENRNSKAMQLKLDELIRTLEGTRPDLLNLEDESNEKMEETDKNLKKHKEKNRKEK